MEGEQPGERVVIFSDLSLSPEWISPSTHASLMSKDLTALNHHVTTAMGNRSGKEKSAADFAALHVLIVRRCEEEGMDGIYELAHRVCRFTEGGCSAMCRETEQPAVIYLLFCVLVLLDEALKRCSDGAVSASNALGKKKGGAAKAKAKGRGKKRPADDDLMEGDDGTNAPSALLDCLKAISTITSTSLALAAERFVPNEREAAVALCVSSCVRVLSVVGVDSQMGVAAIKACCTAVPAVGLPTAFSVAQKVGLVQQLLPLTNSILDGSRAATIIASLCLADVSYKAVFDFLTGLEKRCRHGEHLTTALACVLSKHPSLFKQAAGRKLLVARCIPILIQQLQDIDDETEPDLSFVELLCCDGDALTRSKAFTTLSSAIEPVVHHLPPSAVLDMLSALLERGCADTSKKAKMTALTACRKTIIAIHSIDNGQQGWAEEDTQRLSSLGNMWFLSLLKSVAAAPEDVTLLKGVEQELLAVFQASEGFASVLSCELGLDFFIGELFGSPSLRRIVKLLMSGLLPKWSNVRQFTDSVITLLNQWGIRSATEVLLSSEFYSPHICLDHIAPHSGCGHGVLPCDLLIRVLSTVDEGLPGDVIHKASAEALKRLAAQQDDGGALDAAAKTEEEASGSKLRVLFKSGVAPASPDDQEPPEHDGVALHTLLLVTSLVSGAQQALTRKKTTNSNTSETQASASASVDEIAKEVQRRAARHKAAMQNVFAEMVDRLVKLLKHTETQSVFALRCCVTGVVVLASLLPSCRRHLLANQDIPTLIRNKLSAVDGSLPCAAVRDVLSLLFVYKRPRQKLMETLIDAGQHISAILGGGECSASLPSLLDLIGESVLFYAHSSKAHYEKCSVTVLGEEDNEDQGDVAADGEQEMDTIEQDNHRQMRERALQKVMAECIEQGPLSHFADLVARVMTTVVQSINAEMPPQPILHAAIYATAKLMHLPSSHFADRVVPLFVSLLCARPSHKMRRADSSALLDVKMMCVRLVLTIGQSHGQVLETLLPSMLELASTDDTPARLKIQLMTVFIHMLRSGHLRLDSGVCCALVSGVVSSHGGLRSATEHQLSLYLSKLKTSSMENPLSRRAAAGGGRARGGNVMLVYLNQMLSTALAMDDLDDSEWERLVTFISKFCNECGMDKVLFEMLMAHPEHAHRLAKLLSSCQVTHDFIATTKAKLESHANKALLKSIIQQHKQVLTALKNAVKKAAGPQARANDDQDDDGTAAAAAPKATASTLQQQASALVKLLDTIQSMNDIPIGSAILPPPRPAAPAANKSKKRQAATTRAASKIKKQQRDREDIGRHHSDGGDIMDSSDEEMVPLQDRGVAKRVQPARGKAKAKPKRRPAKRTNEDDRHGGSSSDSSVSESDISEPSSSDSSSAHENAPKPKPKPKVRAKVKPKTTARRRLRKVDDACG
ncbi:unnamed protein product [Vitrella brassicaformis CCMP3155]|uniref:Uncharacterized protein n=1 Tax=Vitrella brassicaformis (strain CCMP3155) TaxID=1169540 RepID=A0A0G4EF85_VITBC|nr:unnamed protein product [Vitrella brassicaformis CCMP3155]|eukprot:CEL94400.1 unnamed protein product [Vitrella brassicaformis CCMP3155]